MKHSALRAGKIHLVSEYQILYQLLRLSFRTDYCQKFQINEVTGGKPHTLYHRDIAGIG